MARGKTHSLGFECGAIHPVPGGFGKRVGQVRLAFGKPEKNVLEMLYAAAVDLDALGLEQFDLFLNGGPPCLALESTHPTGCGHDPMSGHLGRIGIVFHGLADPAIGSGSEGMGNFLVGRYTPFGHLPQ